MNRVVILHDLPDIAEENLPDFVTVSRTASRNDMLTAIGGLEHAVLFIDLDNPDAFTLVSSALEVKPRLAIIGVLGSNDLGRVLQAQRNGVRQAIRRPMDPTDVAAALIEVWKISADEFASSQIYAVFGTVGGAGATTVACTLAAELARVTQSKTGLIDLDFDFGGVARAFDLSPRFTVADLSNAGAGDKVLLHKTAIELPNSVAVIARPPTIRAGHAIDDASAKRIIKLATRAYPHLVVDLPRRLDATTGAVVEMCNRLLVVLQLTVPAIDNARRLLEALHEEGVPADRIELVVNRHRKNLHSCTPEMVEKQLGQKVFGVIPNDFQAVSRALDTGQPLDAKHPVRAAINDLATKLTGGESNSGPRKGWLSSLGLTSR